MQAPTRRRTTQSVEEEGVSVEKQSEVVSGEGVVPFLAEAFVAFVFWSLFAEAVPALWYIPMNNMELSGVEPFLFVYVFPAVLAVRAVREKVLNTPLLHLLHGLGLVAMFAPNVLLYGSGVIVASGVALVVIIGQWLLHPNAATRERHVFALFLGLLSLTVVRFGLSSISPLFTYPSWTIVSLILLIISALILHQHRGPVVRLALKDSPSSPPSSRSDLAVAAGFGAFLMLNTFYLSEHGVIARWDEVHPFPFGLAFLAAFVAGIFLSRTSFARSWIWFIVTLFATLFTLIYNQPLGAFVGLVLISYLVSVWPAIVEELNRLGHYGTSFVLMGLVYTFGCLGTVWCVAYNFVPGGFAVREWTPQLVLLYLVLTKMSYTAVSTSSASAATAATSTSAKGARTQNVKLLLIGLAVVAVLLFAPAFLKRVSAYHNYDAHGLDTSNVRGMVWATHFGYDNFGRPSFEDLLGLIKHTKSNVVALVETDIMRLFSGNRDLTEYFEEQLHMYADYGSSSAEHTWGCAILSAFPFKRVERVKLPSPDGENACLIDVTLDVNGKDIDVIMAHFGNTEHVRDRRLQTEDTYIRLKSRIDANKRVLWLGYFTSAPGSPNYNRVMSTGVIDSTNAADRYCEYIWYKNIELKQFKRINQGHVSDTEIQYAEFAPF